MAYATRTVSITKDWTLVTAKVALIQFNDEMFMALSGGETPTEKVGFRMLENEKYVNGQGGMHVWAKSKSGGTNIESVRVAEDVA